MGWLEELESKLRHNEEEQSLIYYEGLKHRKLDSEQLEAKATEWRKILLDPDLWDMIEGELKSETHPVTRRKLELLRKWIIMTRINYNKELFELRHSIEKKVNTFRPIFKGKELGYAELREIVRKDPDRNNRREAYMAVKPLLESIRGEAIESIKLANALARKEGFTTYADLVLHMEGFTENELLELFDKLKHYTNPAWQQLIELTRDNVTTDIQLYDLTYMVYKLTHPPDHRFPRDKLLDSLNRTLEAFDLDLDALPVKIEFCDIPYGGVCVVLKHHQDVRLLMNPREGYTYYGILFHEFGHALHSLYSPDSILLRDEAPFSEGMADVWAGLLEERSWLNKFTEMTPSEVEQFLTTRPIDRAYAFRPTMRDFVFELQLYRNPDAKFEDIWTAVSEQYLDFKDDTGIWPYFSFTYPLYIKNYVLSRLIKEVTYEFIHDKYGEIVGNPHVVRFLIENYYQPGNLVHWRDKIKSSTGSDPLTSLDDT